MSDTSIDSRLSQMADTLKRLRGSPDERLQSELALTRGISIFGENIRVLCRGEWQSPEKHRPAVLTYNSLMESFLVWIAADGSGNLETVEPKYFHSTIPHAAIAKEVMMERDANCTI